MILTSVTQALRDETAEQHRAIEAVPALKHIFEENYTLAGYVDLLKRYYGFYQPLESELMKDRALVSMFDLNLRMKLPKLVADLKRFGFSQTELAMLPRCPELPPMDTLAHRVGVLYVLEGSTLGSQLIVRRLKEVFADQAEIDGEQGVAFYTGYGELTGPRWQAFKQTLEQEESLNTESGIRDVVDGAKATFDELANWLSSASDEIPSHG